MKMRTFSYLLSLAASCLTCSLLSVSAAGDGVWIHYEKEAQVEFVSPGGIRVLIDIANPSLLTRPATAEDILLTTHMHFDHYDIEFLKAFDGTQIQAKAESLERGDIRTFGIVASHSVKLPSDPGGGDNTIFVIDGGGMRIVHFGDTEQRALTPEQLEALGKVDVAFMPFIIDPVDKYKFFDMMDQVKPRLIIPTHLYAKTPQHAVEKWRCVRRDEKSLTLAPENLPEETTFIFLADRAIKYGKVFNLTEWEPK